MAIHTTYTDARANFAAYCTRATVDREPVIISRRDAEDVVLVAADELRGLMETAHLLRSPKNARRLMNALERAKRKPGKLETVESLHEETKLGKKKK